MDLPVLDGDGVDAQLLGHEVNSIEAVLHLLDLGILGHSAGAGHRGGQVKRSYAWEKEGRYLYLVVSTN